MSDELGSLESILERLTATAAQLNDVSNTLSERISQIDASLSSLNLGIGAWQPCAEGTHLSVGYVRMGSIWGLAIKHAPPNAVLEDFWPFNRAPRAFRIAAVPYILPLLEDTLLRKANDLVVRLHKAHALAQEMAAGAERAQREIAERKTT